MFSYELYDDVTAEDDNYCPEGLQESILYFLIECAHKKLKGETRPINSENDRAFVLDGLKAVDYTVIFDEDTPEELIAYLSNQTK